MLNDVATTKPHSIFAYYPALETLTNYRIMVQEALPKISIKGINQMAFAVSTDTYSSPDMSTETFNEIPFTPFAEETLSITYRNSALVEDFMVKHPQIIHFLKIATSHLHKYFGNSLELVLEVLHYPEPGANDELVAWIQSSFDIAEGLDKLEQFEDEWYLDNIGELGRYFNINIETL